MSDLVVLLVSLALLLVAAFAAMAETAISRISRVKAHHLAQEHKSKSAERLVRIVEDPAPFLSVMMLTMLAAHVTAAVVVARYAFEEFGSVGWVITAVGVTLLLFVFAELVPKTFTVQRLESTALTLARPIYLLGKGLQPLGRLLIGIANAAMVLLPGKGLAKGPFVTEDEIRHLVDVAEEEEEIEEDERELIHSIFEFGDTVVREVMVPRPDMIAMPASATLSEALKTIVEAGYSRIPIFEGDTDNIVGLLYAKDVLKRLQEDKSDAPVSSIGRAPFFVPEQKKVAELLREMQDQRVHMAIVVDEYGGTAGLVTIEDLLEEIVGEIVDEYDKEEPLVEPIDAETFRVDAKMAIDEINDLLGVELPHEEWDTVGGLVFGLTGRVPAVGEKVRFDGLEFTTERVTGRRIQKVVVSKVADEPAQSG